MSLRSRATAALGRAVRRLAGETVTYHRGDESVRITAAAGQRLFAAESGQGMPIEVRTTDWLVVASDLVLGGVAAEPERDDLIRWDRGDGLVRVFQVLPPDGDEKAWRYTSPAEDQYRIHARHVRNEEA